MSHPPSPSRPPGRCAGAGPGRAALLAALLLLAGGALAASACADGGAPPGAVDPERPFVVRPDAAAVVGALLETDARGRSWVAGFEVVSVAVGPRDIVFSLRPPAAGPDGGAPAAAPSGPPLALAASHPQNGPPGGAAVLVATEAVVLSAAPSDAAALEPAARALASGLAAVPWERHAPPASPPPERTLTVRDVWAVAGPVVLWALTILVGVLLGRAARPVFRQPGRRLPLPALALLAAVSGALRAALGSPWPLTFVTVERLAAGASTEFQVLPALAAPATALGADPLFATAALGLVLSALAPVLAALLVTAWTERPVAGWVAGLLVAVWPLQLRLAQADASAAAAQAVLLTALLATEVLARRPGRGPALACGLAWALLVPIRPELPAWLLLPAVWLALDRRLRVVLRRPSLVALAVLPVLLSLGIDTVLRLGDDTIEPVHSPLHADYWRNAPWGLWRLFADPTFHPPLLTALALAGVALWPGRNRVLLALGAVPLPLGLALLGADMTGHPWAVAPNFRYVLAGHAFLAFLAAAPIVRLVTIRGSGRARFAARLAGAALLLGALLMSPLYGDFVRTPSPLQWEHAFLDRHAAAVPVGATLVVFGGDQPGEGVPAQAAWHLRRAWQAARPPDAPPPPEPHVTDRAGAEGATDLWYLRGWYEYVAPGLPHTPSVGAWRDALAARYTLERVVCETRHTEPYPPALDGELELCLFRLHAR